MMKFTETHLWAVANKNDVKIGVTRHICQEIGEIVHISLPKVGEKVSKEGIVAVLESTKSAIDLHSPFSGIIVEVNEHLEDDISLLNETPESDGWLFVIAIDKIEDFEKLLSEKEYLERTEKGLM